MNDSDRLMEYLEGHPFIGRLAFSLDKNGTVTETKKELQSILDNCLMLVDPQPATIEFHEAYEMVVSYVLEDDCSSPETAIPSGKRICALCKRSEPEASFANEAHLLPKLLGHKELVTAEECDECNSRTGTEYEAHLGSLLIENRVLLHLMSQSSPGTIRLKPKGSRCRIGGQPVGNPLEIVLVEGDDGVRIVKWEDCKIKLAYRRTGYRPQNASKSIGKSVYLSLPCDQRNEYDSLRNWVYDECSYARCVLKHVFIPGPSLKNTVFTVWKARELGSGLSPLIAMLAQGNVVLLWSYPDFDDKPYTNIYPHIPRPLFDGLSVRVRTITSVDSSRIPDGEAFLEFHYDASAIDIDMVAAKSKISFRNAADHLELFAECEIHETAPGYRELVLSKEDIAGRISLEIRPGLEVGIRFEIGEEDPDRVKLLTTFNLLKLIEQGGQIKIENTITTIPFDLILDATLAPIQGPLLDASIEIFWTSLYTLEERLGLHIDTLRIDRMDVNNIVVIGQLLSSGSATFVRTDSKPVSVPKDTLSTLAATPSTSKVIYTVARFNENLVRIIQGITISIPVSYEIDAEAITPCQHDSDLMDVHGSVLRAIRIGEPEIKH